MTLRALLVASAAFLAASAAVWAQMATADRVQGPGFWPTQPTPARADFLGPAACARCHASHAQSQAGTSMARTAMKPEDAPRCGTIPRCASGPAATPTRSRPAAAGASTS